MDFEILIRDKGGEPKWVSASKVLGRVRTPKTYSPSPPSLFDEDDFIKWWNLYDKKTTRKQTIEFWKKNIKPDLVETIMNHTKKYVKAREDKSKRKDPIRYLRDEAYYDEIIEYKNFEKKIDLDELYPFDTTGNSRKGRCSACNKVVFGGKFTIHNEDSDCCKVKINKYR